MSIIHPEWKRFLSKRHSRGVKLRRTSLCSCNVNGYGFKLICIAPKHTSEPFGTKVRTEKDKILFARNKWLIAHKDSDIEGAFYGLKGDTEAV